MMGKYSKPTFANENLDFIKIFKIRKIDTKFYK